MSSLDLNLLPALDALLSHRNVTAAARQIGVSQPTMSGMLGRLREQLDDPLLTRVGRSMELTARGVALLPEVRQMLLALEKLTTVESDFDAAALRRHFRIMASEFGLFLLLPRIIAQIAAVAPHVTFEMVAIDKPVDSVYGGLIELCLTGDIITHAVGEAARAVRTRTLMEDRFVGIVDLAHPLRGKASSDDLLVYPHVATHFLGSKYAVEDIAISGLSDRHPPRVRVPSFLSIAPMVAGTDSIGLAPARLAPQICSLGGVREIELPRDTARIAIKMLWHMRHDHDPAHEWLRGIVLDICAEHLGANVTRMPLKR
ncbi:LysR family transcriptional regulator [Sphingomonas sp. SRS2]|uniref:LysR family transcriptional regulator n=1 Tax=Sphingomonas sp. SRS2 TaxID=133190 RepID=UPI0006183F68|nr:LysR family transcriptional regulator [Sphingomonas sp. SRS2]KKC27007.1 hypothetical protein WP12_05990 [Sphingomonas sp. SRS2]